MAVELDTGSCPIKRLENIMAKKSWGEWIKTVDAIIVRRVGLSHDDLPDCPYRAWYDEGVSPSRAASMAVRNAMG